jgi:Slx4 endonuclease
MERDLVVLSSSPPRLPELSVTPPSIRLPTKRTFVPNSSSPTSDDLPSLEELIRNRATNNEAAPPPAPNVLDKRLESGSRAAPVPKGAHIGFQTVRGLVETKQLSFGKDHEEGFERNGDKSKSRGKSRSPAEGEPEKRRDLLVTGKLKRSTKAARAEKPSKALESGGSKDIYDFDAELSVNDPGPVSEPKAKERANASSVAASKERTQAVASSRLNKTLPAFDAFACPESDVVKEQEPVATTEKPKKRRGKAQKASEQESKTGDNQLPELGVNATTKTAKTTSKTSNHFRQPREMDDERQKEQQYIMVPEAANHRTTELIFVPYEVPEAPIRPPAKAKEKKLKAKAKSTGKSSEHFAGKQASKGNQPSKSDEKAQSEEQGSNSENVSPLRRKVDWTPPLEDSFVNISALETSDVPTNSDPTVEAASKTSFTSMVQNYGYDNPKSPPKDNMEPTAEKVPTKRKRIELVHAAATDVNRVTAPSRNASAKLGKSPAKKRPKTVTAVALEAYQPLAPESHNDQIVSNFFGPRVQPQSPQTSPIENQLLNVKPKRATRRVQAKNGKVGKIGKRAAKKKVEPPKPKILSPQALARRIEQQALHFGTSSQLVRGDDPPSLQDLQRALRVSEAAFEPSNQDDGHNLQIPSRKLGRGLWELSAETVDDSVLAIELINAKFPFETQKVKTNPPSAGISTPNIGDMADSPPPALAPAEKVCEDVYKDISDFTSSPRPANVVPQVATELITVNDDASGGYLPTPDDSFEAAARSPSSLIRSGLGLYVPTRKAEPQRQALRALSTNSSPQKRPRGRPRKEKTQIHEERSVAKEVPITTEAGAVATSVGHTTCTTKSIETTSTKRPRGRPQKVKSAESLKDTKSKESTSTAEPPKSEDVQQGASKAATQPSTPNQKEKTWQTIDEIEDSEPDTTPSPPRRLSPTKMPPPRLPTLVSSTSAPPALESMTSANNGTVTVKSASHPGWPAVASKLFPKITEVVKTAPPSTDSAILTWYDKILLYDPIVIEDLTAWLNEQGLRIPGKPRLNGTESVKSKGKAKSKGKEKGNDKEGEVNMRPLDPWMVQKWCEENGICCLWKENVVGGSRNRY